MSPSSRKLANDCFATPRKLMTHEEAMALLRRSAAALTEAVTMPLARARGRILARDVIAPRDIPAFDNAAMDGFAIAHADLDGQGETVLPVSMRVFAGDVLKPLPRGTAARIFTGAPMPEGADTCVMQEDAPLEGERAIFPPGVKKGINVRPAGEDQAKGAPVVRRGFRLRPPELAAIASTGQADVEVFKPLRVALMSSGDEIIRPGAPWREGRIYDANHFILRGALEALGAEVADYGILPDRRETVEAAYAKAAAECDVIVASAGASQGEADYMAEAVARMGRLHAWRLAIKPGKPIGFGQIGDTVFLGLPGNPVAAFVTFLIYGHPLLSALGGHVWREPARHLLPAGFSVKKRKTGRREFLRGWVETDAGGASAVRRYPRDGSGLISSAVAAEGVIELVEETESIAEGDLVRFIPFGAFGIGPK